MNGVAEPATGERRATVGTLPERLRGDSASPLGYVNEIWMFANRKWCGYLRSVSKVGGRLEARVRRTETRDWGKV